MPALLNLFPRVEQAVLYETQAILAQMPQVIGASILGGFGMGPVAAINNLVKQQSQLMQLMQNPAAMTSDTKKAHGHAYGSLLAAYAGALNSLTAFQLAGQYLQQSINPGSPAGTMLQSRLATISNTQRVATENLKLLTSLGRILNG
ncbi:hypothetical protein KTD31_03310 [Burkholderia multivorans]|uniref:hypothetical protein n=1 Tax=Burkholderia multivorans TaxID=87883 RepID=UPI001C233F77|nr:hypothetical protein [Burkholderia multivorans]MBU9200381.1 hypothetical protein [Burkholderia multivorans]MDN8078494.1 hypothetical protein [Burkholderia multivorans]